MFSTTPGLGTSGNAEDRTSNAIAQIADAPKKMLTAEKAAPSLSIPAQLLSFKINHLK